MTERTRMTLNKFSIILGIVVILVTFIATMTRAIDASTQALRMTEQLAVRIETETSERMAEGRVLADAITAEREMRKDEYTKIQVKLMEIETRLLYIQQGIDSIKKQ